MPHLLKRLELNGFKSFANKTILEFPAGITAIVGPNGSGKSNVIDAIRWLLGERDAKNLRGGKGEDLIFAGTPKRPRVGLAQASLHFDNRSKFFPVDFTEVTVMREISRDGESEYFLNKSEVRLKDIVDFFAAGRLGSRGITVVTQGNSDMVLRASPVERREMIEEVLGLKEYQLKKNEAERRLKNSQINLDKVKALMEEIAPHLRSLKRQTSRWDKRDEFEGELRDLENKFFGTQFKALEHDLQKVEADLRGHEAKRTELEKRKNAAEERVKQVEANEPKEREELKILKASIKEIEEKRNVLQRELTKLETEITIAARTAAPAAGASSDRLLKIVHSAKAMLEAALQSGELEDAVKSVLKEIDAVLKSAETSRKESISPEVKREFEKVGRELRDLENRILELRDRERSLEKNQEAFYTVFKEVLAEVQASRNAVDEWSRAEQGKTLEHERLLMRKQELEHRIHEVGRRPEEFKAVSHEALHDAQEAERRMFRLRGELAAMGDVDEAVINEAKTTEERYQFLERESQDLVKAEADLKQLIKELNDKIRSQFTEALVKINEEFQKFFELMFGGGTAKLKLIKKEPRAKKSEEDEEEVSAEPEEEENQEEGIDVQVSLPRKRLGSLDALSGGERSLVGIATVFALISVSPPPFLVLDEIDAPLDERNARRFAEMLKEFSKETQFIIVTHNRATMEAADVLYGVTLGEDGTSKVLSLKFEAAEAAVRS
jgi:chromosome segregation ATPase